MRFSPWPVIWILLFSLSACSEPMEQNPRDAGPGQSPPDVGDPVADAGPETPTWDWTWLDCRQAWQADALEDEDQERCNGRHQAPPPPRRFGLHWVFLGHDTQVVETYPESQLDDLNAIYAANSLTFFNHSRMRIANPIATEGANSDVVYTVEDLLPDLGQALQVTSDDPQVVLDTLLDRLRSRGAQVEVRDGLPAIGFQTRVTAKAFHGWIARLHNDLITVVVRQAQGEKSTGTYPQRGTTNPVAGMIYLASPTPLSALPHEMGHFFGLPHTHGGWNRKPGAEQDWQRSVINRETESDWLSLQALAGASYSSDFRSLSLPYDASEEDVEAFENGQALARKVLGWTELTYLADFQALNSDAEFIEHIRAGASPKMKNFVRSSEEGSSFSGNNCGKNYASENRRHLRCKYGDNGEEPTHILDGDDSILAGSVLFADSTESNLMSYINTDTSDGQRRKRHLTARQRDLIHLGTLVPSRQRLRNFAP